MIKTIIVLVHISIHWQYCRACVRVCYRNLKMSTTAIVLRSMRNVKVKNDVTSKSRVYNSPLYKDPRL